MIKVKRNLQANGLFFVKDLFDEEGNMLGYGDFVQIIEVALGLTLWIFIV